MTSKVQKKVKPEDSWGGGGAEGQRAGKHSGFQNNPGFEMLERLDSGPFLKLGREGREGEGTQANLELLAQGGGKGLTEVVQSVGIGTHKVLPC